MSPFLGFLGHPSTLGMMHSGGSCKVEASAKSQQSNLVSVNVCQQKLLKGLWADILSLRWAQCHQVCESNEKRNVRLN